MGTLNILEWSKANNINQLVTILVLQQQLVYLSLYLLVQNTIKSISPYGISKSISEDYTLYYASKYNLDYKVLDLQYLF